MDTNFYIIQLEPEVDPERIKFGVAKSVRKRFNDYHLTHFDAILLAEWPIDRQDEVKTITEMVDGLDCEHVKGEVYDVFDIPGLMERARKMMPSAPIYLGELDAYEKPVSGRRTWA